MSSHEAASKLSSNQVWHYFVTLWTLFRIFVTLITRQINKMINSLAYRLIQWWPNFYVAQIWQLWLADHRLQRTWPKSGFHGSKRERYHCTMRLTSMAQSGANRNISRDRFGLSDVFWCLILEAEKMRGKKWVNCFRIQILDVFFETVFTNRYLEQKLIYNKW